MSHRESLEYLYGLQRFGIKLGLDNIRGLLAFAGAPQRQMNLVHVAGTNGKGSVSAILSTLIQKAGHRTGLYTSPHLQRFNERIRVDQQPISDERMVLLTEQLKPHCGEQLPATFFEFTTAMALCHFRDCGVEWAVLETGMGGRLDATNAVTPDLCVITSISLDHSEHLGGSLAQVAAEKAGIIKKGVPVVSAPQPDEVLDVLKRRAAELQAPLYVCGEDFHYTRGSSGIAYRGIDRFCEGLPVPLEGAHQAENLALALVALELTGLWPAADCAKVAASLGQVAWPGRLEWWPGESSLLLDGAHNVAGCRTLAAYLADRGEREVVLLFGAKGDKAAEAMLSELLPYTSEVLLVEPPVEEAADLERLESRAEAAGVPVRCHGDWSDGLLAGLKCADTGKTLVIAGSLFLVGAVREALSKQR